MCNRMLGKTQLLDASTFDIDKPPTYPTASVGAMLRTTKTAKKPTRWRTSCTIDAKTQASHDIATTGAGAEARGAASGGMGVTGSAVNDGGTIVALHMRYTIFTVSTMAIGVGMAGKRAGAPSMRCCGGASSTNTLGAASARTMEGSTSGAASMRIAFGAAIISTFVGLGRASTIVGVGRVIIIAGAGRASMV